MKGNYCWGLVIVGLDTRSKTTARPWGSFFGVWMIATIMMAAAIASSANAQEETVSAREYLTLKGHTNWVSGISYSPDGKQLASVSWDKTVRIWNAETGKATLELPEGKSELSSVVFGPDGRHVAVVGFDYAASIIDVTTGETVTTLDGRVGEPISFSADGQQLMAICANKERQESIVAVWEAASGKKLRALQGHSGANEFCYQVVYSPNRTRHAVTIMNANEEGVRMKIMESQPDKVEQRDWMSLEGAWAPLAFSPDGQWLAAVTADRSIQLLSMKKDNTIRKLESTTGNINCVAFSPDGRYLAGGKTDGTIGVWSTTSGQEKLTLKGHTHNISCVVFSLDGKRLATSGFDNTIRVWDLQFSP